MQPGEDGYYWVEAPFLDKSNGMYYLYMSWYGCCSTNANYETRVCRSQNILGPYTDENGQSQGSDRIDSF